MSYIFDSISRNASLNPKSIALKNFDVSYQSLVQRVELFANEMQKHKCHTVAIELDNGEDWVYSDLAAMKLGLTIVPIPSFFTDEQIEHLLEQASVDYWITSRRDPLLGEWQELNTVLTHLHIYSRTTEPVTQAAKITFTSGSTNHPKGVVLDQKIIDATTSSIVESLATIHLERHLSVLPLATLLENIAGLYSPLVNGSEIYLPTTSEVGLTGASLDLDAFINLFGTVAADSTILVPQLLTAITSLSEASLIDMSNYKMIAVGGGRVSRALLEKSKQLKLPVFEGYGLSECGSVLTLNLPNANKPGSTGKPLPHAEIQISPSSEILVKGAVMQGYLGDKSNSEQSWYPTGDLGHFDDEGYLYISGRKKNVFITTYGRNVNPEWLEAALGQKPEISQALAFGEAKEHNLALIWPRFATSRCAMDQVVREVNLELPDYAQIHEFILMTEPLAPELQTSNGRLKREIVIHQFSEVIATHYATKTKERLYAAS